MSVPRKLQKVSSSLRPDDSYMYGKLLEFLRVSSLDPEFLIQCPDPVNEFSSEASKPRARISGSGLRSFSAQVGGSGIPDLSEETPRLEMTHRVLFEIIGNSSTVPVPEFQYCPEFQNFRTPPQRLTRIPASVAEGGVVGQEFPRGRARDTRARPTQYSDPA